MTDRTTQNPDDFESRLTRALRNHYATGSFPRAEIERDLQDSLTRKKTEAPVRQIVWWRSSTVRSLLTAAAAVLLFIGGVEYGRHTADPPVETWAITEDASRPGAVEPPLSIQASGSRYVASLARFTEEAPALSERQLRVGREVALTALYAAAAELLRIYHEDPLLRETVRSLAVETSGFANEVEINQGR